MERREGRLRAGDGEVGALVGGVVAHCGGVGAAVYGRAHVCAHGAQVRIGHRTQHDHVRMPCGRCACML